MASSGASPDSGTPPFVPGFAEDVFISYGHIDNAGNWVSALHDRLLERVPEILGAPVRIWRDRKLGGADALWELIEDRLANTALCLSVVTPRYVTSDSCMREARRFLECAGANGGIKVGDMVRLVRVLKTPYAAGREPPEMAAIATLGFQFFRTDPQASSTFEEFPAAPALPGYDEFYTTSEKLAQAVAKLLKRMQAARAQALPAKTAYVAHTTADRKLDRDTVVNTLASKGFRIVPGENRPELASELTSDFEAHSKEWDVAVHVVGSRAGTVLEDDPRPIVRLEYELVRAAAVKPGFRQLVWIPDGLGEPDAAQGQFLEELKTVGDGKTEILRTGLARLIDTVNDQLNKKPAVKRTDKARSVFLMCTRDDLEHPGFKAIRKYLLDNGIYYEEPAFDGDPAMLEELRNQSISSTDAALIYYGTAPDGWVQMMRIALRKTLASAANRAKYVRTVYLCEPPDPLKKNKYLDLPAREVPEPGYPPLLVLGDCEPFVEDKLAPLFDHLAEGAP